MKRSPVLVVVLGAFGVASCANVLGLDQVRNCEGAECGDATTDVSQPDAAQAEAASDVVVVPQTKPTDFGTDLVLWLDASQKVQTVSGGAVALWEDLTPNDWSAIQTATGQQPALHKQGLAGHDAVRFVDSTQYMQIADPSDAGSPLQFGANRDFVIAALVAAKDDTNTPGAIWNKAATLGLPANRYGDGTILGFGIDQNDLVDGGPPDASAYAGRISYQNGLAAPETVWTFGPNGLGADTAPHLVLLHRAVSNNVTSLEIRVDGSPGMSQTVTSSDVSHPGIPITIGGPHLPGASFQAGMLLEIAEIVAVSRNGAFTNAEITGLEAYFMTKYVL